MKVRVGRCSGQLQECSSSSYRRKTINMKSELSPVIVLSVLLLSQRSLVCVFDSCMTARECASPSSTLLEAAVHPPTTAPSPITAIPSDSWPSVSLGAAAIGSLCTAPPGPSCSHGRDRCAAVSSGRRHSWTAAGPTGRCSDGESRCMRAQRCRRSTPPFDSPCQTWRRDGPL